MREKIENVILPVFVLVVLVIMILFAVVEVRQIEIQEGHCENACLEEGWPIGRWKRSIETCYCENKLEAKKLYTGEQENE